MTVLINIPEQKKKQNYTNKPAFFTEKKNFNQKASI